LHSTRVLQTMSIFMPFSFCATYCTLSLKKLPKVKALNAEYSDLLTQKKAAYPDYRKAREEMQEFVKAQKNIELFFAEEKDAQEKQKTR
ncbi:MAG: hypothetical protein MR538_04635, partial [Faecalibacterium prausnitzii]|nr:hypothetical protein [Faecalibacterium prausnitzii]